MDVSNGKKKKKGGVGMGEMFYGHFYLLHFLIMI